MSTVVPPERQGSRRSSSWAHATRGKSAAAARLPGLAGLVVVGTEAPLLLPNLEHDLATSVSACDPLQRLSNLLQRQDCFDLRAELVRLDQAGKRLQSLPVDIER